MPTGHLFRNLNIISRNSSQTMCGEYIRGKEERQAREKRLNRALRGFVPLVGPVLVFPLLPTLCSPRLTNLVFRSGVGLVSFPRDRLLTSPVSVEGLVKAIAAGNAIVVTSLGGR